MALHNIESLKEISGELKEQVKYNKEQKKQDKEFEIAVHMPPYIKYHETKDPSKSYWAVDTKELAKYIRTESKYLFARNKATEGINRYWYRNGVYKLISDDEFKGYIKSYIMEYTKLAFIKWNMGDVWEVFRDLITDTDNFITIDELNANENIINFENGLYHIDTGELTPHTPSIYSTIQIPCNYNPNSASKSTVVFDKFMNDFTGGDEGKKRLLMQYVAVAISSIYGYRLKKGLIVVGKGNSGKSRLKKFTESLLGTENFSNTDLETLEKRFGTSCLYNTRLVGSSDMTNPTVKALANFKQAVGGDSIMIEFKGRTAFYYTYKGLFWYCCNQLPKFGGDTGEWVYDRFIVLRADNTIPPEKRDKYLNDKLFKEREAVIAKYLIPALKQVIENNYNFDIPESCNIELEKYKEENSVVIQFYKECCTERPQERINDNCTTKKMYDIFKEWCKDNSHNGYTPSKTEFNRQLAEMFYIDDIKLKMKKVKGNWYYTFTLNQEIKKDFEKVYGTDSICTNE